MEFKVQTPHSRLYKGSIFCDTSSDSDTLISGKRKGFAVSPLDRATAVTCCDTVEKERFCSFPRRHGEAKGKPEARRDKWEPQNEHFVRDFFQFLHLDTFAKDKFRSFPHRHGEARAKPETQDKTAGSLRTSISCETSSNFDTFALPKGKVLQLPP